MLRGACTRLFGLQRTVDPLARLAPTALAHPTPFSTTSTVNAPSSSSSQDKGEIPAWDPRSTAPHPLSHFFADMTQTIPKEDLNVGRAWRASELRAKSFEDLHKLWYILIRERNRINTQRKEMARYRHASQRANLDELEAKCHKSLGRIRFVLNERRLIWEQAQKIQNRAINQSKAVPKASQSSSQ
ncbi:MAG: mitochondrial 39-S ribosomal protein L47 (MRP-L47)-domain-containing protein [Piptocephalis tieghemiana]|nr:MAG: mitochondrial 39-S ribosomal protein L47 (MRP-L47)-domain-containing protein [Piptocephalis tieghemiana]